MNRSVLITGCSSGIGHAAALHLQRAGWQVYATARNVSSLAALATAGCRTLPLDVQRTVDRVLRRSVEFAFANRAATLPFVRAHAQEMSEEVMFRHIDLYVNAFSVTLGPEGRQAVAQLFERARTAVAIPPMPPDLFVRQMSSSTGAA